MIDERQKLLDYMEKHSSTIYDLVIECYDNALENGADLDSLTAEQVTEDMMDKSICGDYDYSVILTCVLNYKLIRALDKQLNTAG